MKRHVLIVDDQAEIRDVTSTVLESEGYVVTTAGAGSQAIRLLDRERFDLVLLDIDMPGMDGWQTLRMIRADPRLERLPVVMFSVKGEARDKIQSLQEGAVDHVTKPFVVDELVSRLARVLGGAARDAGPAAGAEGG